MTSRRRGGRRQPRRPVSRLTPEPRAALRGSGTFYRVTSLVNGGRAVEQDLFEAT